MNSTNKQHRHPGLWTLPLHSEQQDFAIAPPAQGDEVSAQLSTALAACADDHQLAGRWVTIIGQPDSISATELGNMVSASGLAPHRVRWLRPSDSASKAWAAEQALLLDNSALVVAWLGQCQSRDAQRLQLARRHTRANTLLFSDPAEKTPLH